MIYEYTEVFAKEEVNIFYFIDIHNHVCNIDVTYCEL